MTIITLLMYATMVTTALLANPWLFFTSLMCLCIVIGFIASLAGVGGGVLFTPIMMAFTSINPDVVRSTGLAIATMSSLVSARPYLHGNLANFRLVLVSSVPYTLFAIIGSIIGLHITSVFGSVGKSIIRLSLGILVLAIAALFMVRGNKTDIPKPPRNRDKLAESLRLNSAYREGSLNMLIEYRVVNLQWGLLSLMGVGLVSGMFGLGAGWAIVPVYNMLMYLPLKVASASSIVLIGIGDTAAMWVYINSGAFIPLFAIPCLLGIIIGARLGSRIMPKVKVSWIRILVIIVMIIAGLRLIQQSLPLLVGWLP
ncbi:sulfite exporter TauE/SafE family protein [Caldivirga sp.]|uniref:sulfite exporter TauE/SafE family protein n=1 Tax=Caldivirga sp. TaxID=2080243 RepID=UPI0025BD64AB|nr:sulfite exporter TauE/SafE family protein [Caldivirga sp.]